MLRLALFVGAAPLGLLTGMAAWGLAGGPTSQAHVLDAVDQELVRLRPPPAVRTSNRNINVTDLLSAPLFALTTGPGAVREPSIRVDGIAVSQLRTAALLSIDGKPADWFVVGETREGVTLQAVSRLGVTVETAIGEKHLDLGDQSASSAPIAGSSGPQSFASDPPPPGVSTSPEPASAPQFHR